MSEAPARGIRGSALASEAPTGIGGCGRACRVSARWISGWRGASAAPAFGGRLLVPRGLGAESRVPVAFGQASVAGGPWAGRAWRGRVKLGVASRPRRHHGRVSPDLTERWTSSSLPCTGCPTRLIGAVRTVVTGRLSSPRVGVSRGTVEAQGRPGTVSGLLGPEMAACRRTVRARRVISPHGRLYPHSGGSGHAAVLWVPVGEGVCPDREAHSEDARRCARRGPPARRGLGRPDCGGHRGHLGVLVERMRTQTDGQGRARGAPDPAWPFGGRCSDVAAEVAGREFDSRGTGVATSSMRQAPPAPRFYVSRPPRSPAHDGSVAPVGVERDSGIATRRGLRGVPVEPVRPCPR